jgi:hypothetical protein
MLAKGDKRTRVRIPTMAHTRGKVRDSRGVLYSTIRARLGVKQSELAALLGLSLPQLKHRELYKQSYQLEELVALRTLLDWTWQEFGELLTFVSKYR